MTQEIIFKTITTFKEAIARHEREAVEDPFFRRRHLRAARECRKLLKSLLSRYNDDGSQKESEGAG